VILRALAALAAALLVAQAQAQEHVAGYSERPEVRAFIADLVQRHGFVESELSWLFSRVRRVEPVLLAIQPASQERPRSWAEYRAMFVNERRIAAGAAFWRANRSALERAQREFGVPAQVIVGVIGVETFFGRNTGRWRIVDALTTLAFDYPPRADFFREELRDYLLLARDSGADVFAARGSYAGAIGIPQFMPGSVRRYAVDFDGDGTVDLERSAADAIGSVANFLKQHGWQQDGEIALAARVSGGAYRGYLDGVEPKYPLGELLRAGVEPRTARDLPADARAALVELGTPGRASEYRIGLQNFYVLTRYNRSAFYAAAVADLGRAVARAQEPGR
jgi:membrane-bound lytic murein transglycosylase B